MRLPVHLMRLLGVIAANQERLLSSSELGAAAWPGRLGSESAVHSGVHRLRRAIRDSLRVNIEIRTVREVGYRLSLKHGKTDRPAAGRTDTDWDAHGSELC